MSRSIDDLHVAVQGMATRFLMMTKVAGIDVLITCTWRSEAEQAALYAQGRTTPGKIVTRARPGQSMHNCVVAGRPASLAFDVVPMRNGKPVWAASDPLWQQLGDIGEKCGLEWAGRWKSFREYPHFQHPQAKSLMKGAIA